MSKDKRRGRNNFVILLIITLAVFLTGLFGSLFTSTATKSQWYLENKPSFTPPRIVFSIAWTILYILIILAIYFSWIKSKKSEKIKLLIIFGLNLISNALWSFLFFYLRNPLFGFIDLLIIFSTIIWALFYTKKINPVSTFLLIPYLLWIIFAGILNLSFGL
ncbi:MAG TPA: tryptophan-rich sensory protein [Candidatus Pacearchaeota archaeon]|nr:tryptophan-rich sensory protein [Candidatus Pacearchaeota archaeon]